MASRKRSVIWDYLAVNPEDERIAICNTCDEAISRGGVNAKNYNTSVTLPSYSLVAPYNYWP